ncbi:MAG: pilus assembly protein [Alphaproteobacteria bacterium]|nr:pilus assembly protein [Alphaproteobacteria bacterium]
MSFLSKLSLLSKWRAWRRSQSGATAVEFALVAGPFFYVLGCICETGLMLFTEYVIQNSVQEASRMVRTGQVTAGDGTLLVSADDFKAKICEQVNIIVDCNAQVSVYVNSANDFNALSTAMSNPLDVGSKPDGTPYTVVYTPGAALQAATVIATYDWDFAFPFMDFLGNIDGGQKRRLYGLAIFRNEPFGS